MNYWPGMGRELYAQEPVFRATVQECERLLQQLGGPSLLANFEQAPDPLFWQEEARVVPLMTTLQLALVDLWRAKGVVPEATLGISGGEAAALYAAGGLNRKDALRISLCGGLVSSVEPAAYRSFYTFASAEHAQALCRGCPVGLFVTSVLEQERCCLYCNMADVQVVKAYLQAQGVKSYLLQSEPVWPYHTTRLAQHAHLMRLPLEGTCPQPFTSPCYLTTLGKLAPIGTLLPPDYGLRITQEPILFYATVAAAVEDGYEVFTPVGSEPFSGFTPTTHQELFSRVRVVTPLSATTPECEWFNRACQELANLGIMKQAVRHSHRPRPKRQPVR